MGKSKRAMGVSKPPRFKTIGGQDVKPVMVGRKVLAYLNGEPVIRNGKEVSYKSLPNAS